jgi:lactate dehydrogenase-like 2-hydroxyacid dehydrogenase
MSVAYAGASIDEHMPFTFYESVVDLASRVDFLVLTQHWGEAAHIIDANVLSAIGPKGYFINTTKASWVDAAVLVQMLKNKQIAGAGLDVFWDEPRVPSELRTLSNVVLTPHLGCATVQTRQEMVELALVNLKAFFNGETLLTPVPECQPVAEVVI